MKVGRKEIKMTNLIPWPFSPTNIGTKSIADTGRININETNIKIEIYFNISLLINLIHLNLCQNRILLKYILIYN